MLFTICLTAEWVFSSDEGPSPRPSGDSIRLPSGGVVKIESFDVHPKWKEFFPQDHAFYAEKDTEGKLLGMHSRYLGRLDGPSATLHENGKLKTLVFYPEGRCQGPYRVWDENAKMRLYAKYKDDAKHGVTCLFKDGVPWLVQEWKAGALENETIVARKGNEYAAVDDKEQLAQGKKTLSTVEKELVQNTSDLKKTMRKWYIDKKEDIEKEKEKAISRLAKAQSKVAKQAIRKEEASRVAAAHNHNYSSDSVGRVASVDAAAHARSLGDAQRNAGAVANETQDSLRNLNATLEQEFKELYELAMASLETALPSEPSEAKVNVLGK